MRIAIVSDIHSNIQAWNVVWANIATQKVDKLICLGDIVGYGPRPAETLSAIYKNVDRVIMGNHDAVIAGIDDAKKFNPAARAMIEWTDTQLDAKAKKFFAALPYTFKFKEEGLSILCVHGHPHKPKDFNYVKNNSDLASVWKATHADIIFVGHTHIPRVDILNKKGGSESQKPSTFKIEKGKRYLINTGSVGVPRGSSDFRACYCIYDTDTQTISYHRCAYDIEALKKDLKELDGLPSQAKRVVELFEKNECASIRKEKSFSASNQLKKQSNSKSRIQKQNEKITLKNKSPLIASLATIILLIFASTLFFYYNKPLSATQNHPLNFKQTFLAEDAVLSGPGLRMQKSARVIGFWNSPEDIVTWKNISLSPGNNKIFLNYSCSKGGKKYVLRYGDFTLNASSESTDSLQKYQVFKVGTLQLNNAMTADLSIQMNETKESRLFNLKRMEIQHTISQ